MVRRPIVKTFRMYVRVAGLPIPKSHIVRKQTGIPVVGAITSCYVIPVHLRYQVLILMYVRAASVQPGRISVVDSASASRSNIRHRDKPITGSFRLDRLTSVSLCGPIRKP